MEYVLGIDLGGTNIKGGIVGQDGKIIVSKSVKTHSHRGPDKVIASMVSFSKELISESGKPVLRGGIGCPGPLSQEKGLVYDSPNLPGWNLVPLRAKMEQGTGIRFILENDANAACLGEKVFGAGKPFDPIVHLTLGTGIGGGLFLNGKLFTGAIGGGAELGHMTIDVQSDYVCGCGTRGCLEAFASDSGIRTQVEHEIGEYPDSLLNNYNVSNINFKAVYTAYTKADPFARKLYERVVFSLGVGIANFVNIFNPQAVILSGGMVQAGEEFMEGIEKVVKERAFDVLTQELKILVSTLGRNTGVLGAAACAVMS